MITIDGEKYLDYNEAAKAMHCKYTYVRDSVYQHKLKANSFGLNKKKFIALSEIRKLLMARNKNTITVDEFEKNAIETTLEHVDSNNNNVPVNNITQNDTPVPFPIRQQSLEAISKVNEGYAVLTASLERSLEPLIRTVKNTDTEAFIKEMSQFMQAFMNRLYSLPPDTPIQSMHPMEFFNYIFQDVDIPDMIKAELLQSAINAVEKNQQLEKQNKSA